MDFKVIIPVRYSPDKEKPLKEINGKTLLQNVFETCLQSGAEDIVIATDSEKIVKIAKSFGANVCLTASDHRSGIERVAEAISTLNYDDNDIVVSVACSEHIQSSNAISQVATNLATYDCAKVASICEPISKIEDIFNPEIVKVVLNKRGYALYFSRGPIPWQNGNFAVPYNKNLQKVSTEEQVVETCGIKNCDINIESEGSIISTTAQSSIEVEIPKSVNSKEYSFLHKDLTYYHHMELYAYRAGFLQEYVQWEPCILEKIEKVEALRLLWNGVRLHLAVSGANTKSQIK